MRNDAYYLIDELSKLSIESCRSPIINMRNGTRSKKINYPRKMSKENFRSRVMMELGLYR